MLRTISIGFVSQEGDIPFEQAQTFCAELKETIKKQMEFSTYSKSFKGKTRLVVRVQKLKIKGIGEPFYVESSETISR